MGKWLSQHISGFTALKLGFRIEGGSNRRGQQAASPAGAAEEVGSRAEDGEPVEMEKISQVILVDCLGALVGMHILIPDAL